MVSLRNLLSFGRVSSCGADTPNEAALASSSALAAFGTEGHRRFPSVTSVPCRVPDGRSDTLLNS
jgi:hypothetical protein